jgi:hypothetical protein
MKFSLAVFGAGYVLGTKAGRERYEQIAAVARRVAQAMEGSHAQEMLQTYSSKLETFAAQGRLGDNGDARHGGSQRRSSTS